MCHLLRPGCRTVAHIDAGIATTSSAHEASRSTRITVAPVATRDVVVLVAAVAVDSSVCCCLFISWALKPKSPRSLEEKNKHRFCLSCSGSPTGQNQQSAAASVVKASSRQQPKPTASSKLPTTSHQAASNRRPPARTSHQQPATLSQQQTAAKQPPAKSNQPTAATSQQPPAKSNHQAPERERAIECERRDSEKEPRQCVMGTERVTQTDTQRVLEVFVCFV